MSTGMTRSMGSKVRRLEALRGEVVEPCRVCGYPSNAVRTMSFRSDEVIQSCQRCGRQLSLEGRPAHDVCQCIIAHVEPGIEERLKRYMCFPE